MTHKLTPDQERALEAWRDSLSVARELYPHGRYPERVSRMLGLATMKFLSDPLEATLIYEQAAKESLDLWQRFYGPLDDTPSFFYPSLQTDVRNKPGAAGIRDDQ